MLAHDTARFCGIARGNAGNDAGVLALDALEIGPPVRRRSDRQPHPLTWNHMTAQKGKEARELSVAGRFGDGSMEGKILGDGTVALLQGTVNGVKGCLDARDLLASRMHCGLCGSLDLDGETQLHDIEHVA